MAQTTPPNHDPSPTPPPGKTAPSQSDVTTKPPVSKSRKSAVTFIVIIGVLAVLLLLLNLIPFDKLSQAVTEETAPPVVTYDSKFFEAPVEGEDFSADSEYMDLDRYLYFSADTGETFQIIDNASEYGEICQLFETLRTSVIAGDCDTYNSLFTDDYIQKNGAASFTPQKLYNFRVKVMGSTLLKEGDANGLYKGATVTNCEVNYRIKDNNGTFRNDFYREGDSRTQIYQILDYNGSVKISQISTPTYTTQNQTEKEGLPFMFYIWIAAIVLAIVAEAMTTALVAVWFIPGAIISLILALCDVGIAIQLVTYFVSALVLVIAFKLLMKKFGKKKHYVPTNADRIIGGRAIVTEEINNLTPCGEVKIDGKLWTARTETDGEIIPIGAHVKVLRIEGVKLICELYKDNTAE